MSKKRKSPVICPYCKEEAELVTGKKIYPNRPELHKNKLYECEPCGARVGCHKGTSKPLGRLADTELRYWKMQAHHAFDPTWREGGRDRKMAYKWLARELNIEFSKCHIGMFDVDMCKKVVRLCNGKAG